MADRKLINEYKHNGGKIFKYRDKEYGYIFETYSTDNQYKRCYSKTEAEEFIDNCIKESNQQKEEPFQYARLNVMTNNGWQTKYVKYKTKEAFDKHIEKYYSGKRYEIEELTEKDLEIIRLAIGKKKYENIKWLETK